MTSRCMKVALLQSGEPAHPAGKQGVAGEGHDVDQGVRAHQHPQPVGALPDPAEHQAHHDVADEPAQALLRGAYHLYQGLGGFVGNVVMGLVFGRIWQRTNRLWMLVGAHALIDVVAFAGYALLAGRVGWLP